MKKVTTVHTIYKKYKGQDIWIVGSDPSLSDYPDNFLDDKCGITLHLAHIKFPKATFRYSSEYDRSQFLLEKDSLYKELPLLAALPMYGKTKKETLDLLKSNKEVYYHHMLSYPPYGVRGKISKKFTQFKILQTLKNKAHTWGGHGSCLHTCLYMALLLGAKNIHLIGAGHGLYTKDGLEHFGEVKEVDSSMRPGYRSFTDPIENAPLLEQTSVFRDLCIEQGIGFYWHRSYTPNMNDFIEFDEEWLLNQKKLGTRKFSFARNVYRRCVKGPYYLIRTRM